MRKVVVQFPNLGPYHLARLDAAAAVLGSLGIRVVGLETAGESATYDWRPEDGKWDWDRITLFPGQKFELIDGRRVAAETRRALDRIQPLAVATCGYKTAGPREALKWCRRNSAISILMSETRWVDGRRGWLREWFKSLLVRRFNAAICGGREHRSYLERLGMRRDRIHFGYDVVRNDFFRRGSSLWKRGEVLECRQDQSKTSPSSESMPRRRFIASNRFVERKNLGYLIREYASFVRSSGGNCTGAGTGPAIPAREWDLVLLGDGEMRGDLETAISREGLRLARRAPWEIDVSAEVSLEPTVFLPGFRQIGDLPRFYGSCDCFVHPAILEPWGLVVNEAMASRLPILASTGTGAASDLVVAGVNGWRFDSQSETELSRLMSRLAKLDSGQLWEMGEASWRILEERCPLEAFGHGLAAATEGRPAHCWDKLENT